jgi:hypothetical protein
MFTLSKVQSLTICGNQPAAIGGMGNHGIDWDIYTFAWSHDPHLQYSVIIELPETCLYRED